MHKTKVRTTEIPSSPMPPNRETLMPFYENPNPIVRPPDGLQRTISDISTELTRQDVITKLNPIPEIENAHCDCCGMSEECTPGYIGRVRSEFFGKLVCGLCSEAVRELGKKKEGSMEEALGEHTRACVRFNRVSRAYPVLVQAEAMKEILKKRSKSISPRGKNIGHVAQSLNCVPEIGNNEVPDRVLVNRVVID